MTELADIQWTVYPEVNRQLHVMAQARESSPVIDWRSNHSATTPTNRLHSEDAEWHTVVKWLKLWQSECKSKKPLFAGYDATAVIWWHDTFCLPPIFITGIGHMKHITITECNSMTRQTAVFGWVIVKQCPGYITTWLQLHQAVLNDRLVHVWWHSYIKYCLTQILAP